MKALAPSNNPRTDRIIILGSTGSVGVNTIEVVEHLNQIGPRRFEIIGLAAGTRLDALAAQAETLGVRHVASPDADAKAHLGDRVEHVHVGDDAAVEMLHQIARPGDLVIGAIVGAAGIKPSIAALELGCDLALANKESLVAAGPLALEAAERSGAKIIPVDSEHSAVFQCLHAGRSDREVAKVVLTASGGPFRTWSRDRMRSANVSEALNHPTWSMGSKVTIDSASLMNKGLELIEAHWLFGLGSDRLDAVFHPQSIVHSFVEFTDHAVIAQLSPPDMKLPIQYAISWPDRLAGSASRTDFSSLSDLHFESIDKERFPAIEMALEVIDRPSGAGAIFNAANEVAVARFLEERIPFGAIIDTVKATLERLDPGEITSLEDVLEIDRETRRVAAEILEVSANG
ncbi:MAG: 1-deoxy-D-xylulose-5-phosphate reductoisomerase [Phycisphaerae bacterium]|nr:1-deoxy-D-xylulose-5-phosphate reductoisomerase [Phycisphaerae bacterium]HAW96498.1 1-deoxy-D-xylulose-5-phosphate reductoisomerase [Phycisphaerales bacterium]